MKKGYKLTTQNMTTHKGFEWTLGKTYKTSGDGDLCGPGWLHYYEHPLLAVLHNPCHADIDNPRLFEVSLGKAIKNDRGMKAGSTSMRLVRELELPVVTLEQKVRYTIACACQVYKNKTFLAWANDWISGKDRTAQSAYAATNAAANAAATAAYAATNAAANADAADAAYAAATAAYAATNTLDLIALAKWAVSLSTEIPNLNLKGQN